MHMTKPLQTKTEGSRWEQCKGQDRLVRGKVNPFTLPSETLKGLVASVYHNRKADTGRGCKRQCQTQRMN